METNRTSRTFNTQQYSVDDDTSVERMRTAQPKATSMASELVPFFADQSSPVALRPRVRADGASCDRVATLGCFLSARQKEIVRRLGDRQGLSNEEDKEIIDADQEALNEAIRQSLELDRSIRSAIPERSPDQWMNRNTSGPLQSDESNQETRDTLQPRLEPASASTASRPSAQQREAGAGSRHDAALQPNAGTYNTSGVNAGAGEHNPIRKWVFGEERISPPRQARAKPQAGITQTKPLPPQPNAQQQALAKSSRSDNQWVKPRAKPLSPQPMPQSRSAKQSESTLAGPNVAKGAFYRPQLVSNMASDGRLDEMFKKYSSQNNSILGGAPSDPNAS